MKSLEYILIVEKNRESSYINSFSCSQKEVVYEMICDIMKYKFLYHNKEKIYHIINNKYISFINQLEDRVTAFTRYHWDKICEILEYLSFKLIDKNVNFIFVDTLYYYGITDNIQNFYLIINEKGKI